MSRDNVFPGWSGPFVGMLAGACLAANEYYKGSGEHRMAAGLMYLVLPATGGWVVWLIDWMEHKPGVSDNPSPAVTKVMLALIPFVFWIPVLGLIVASYALYRTRWLTIPEWCAFLLCCLFYLSVAVTLVVALVFGMDRFGMR